MNLQLTQKERTLEDQKMHEEICIQKYTNMPGRPKTS